MIHYFSRFYFIVTIGILLAGAGNAAPVTQTAVSHPTTQVAVDKPRTSVVVTVPVSRTSVSHPRTEGSVQHPVTSGEVSHPVTQVTVAHPRTELLDSSNNKGASANTQGASKALSGKSAAAPMMENKPSMMSSYQAPQAKDLKAAKLGGGAAGLGNKTNEAEKDAAAAASQAPKREEASMESILNNKDSSIKSKVTKAIEDKK